MARGIESRTPALRAGIASGSLGSARQKSHTWRTSGPTFPVTVRRVKVATA